MVAKFANPKENLMPNDASIPNDGRPWIGIFLNADGSVKVNGNIQDSIMAYGLLGVAGTLIEKHLEKNSKVENTRGGILSFMRNGKRIV